MTYEEFTAGIGEYKALFDKGLKKQANKLLFEFTDKFRANVPMAEGDEILCRFCREFLDEGKFTEFRIFGSPNLPYQLTGLIHDCLKRECELNKMPQMRWQYQIFGKYYDPHASQGEERPYFILERAYEHPECDQMTVDLYFTAQLDELGFGAHHFPEGCCIARSVYADCVAVCERILSEKTINPELQAEFREYKALYELYYSWSDGGRHGRFDELCRTAGIDFTPVEAFYYKS